MRRCIQDNAGGALFDDLPGIHNRNPLRQRSGNLKIMSNEQQGAVD